MWNRVMLWEALALVAWGLTVGISTVEAQQPSARRPVSAQDYYHQHQGQSNASPYGYGYAPQSQYNSSVPYGGGYWTPGGYEGRVGSPYYYQGNNGYNAEYYYGNQYGGGYPMAMPAAGWGIAAGNGGFVQAPLPADPYQYHFGPGYYRNQDYGHYRFPWYSYRSPWYYPGHPSYNRDTNLPW